MTIEIPDAVAEKIRATFAGVDISTYVREAVEERLRQNTFAHAPNSAEPTEAELVHHITTGFSEAFWQRYRELRDKLRAESITDTEREEFISLSDEKELHDADRLKHLVLLAHRRQVTVEALMQEMGIHPQK